MSPSARTIPTVSTPATPIAPSARHRRQRGAVAILFLIVITAIAALAGALAVRGTVTDLRAAGAQRTNRTAFYCAEAGLNAARSYFATNYLQWNAMLDPALTNPAGYPVTGDVDGDGVADYQVTLIDNVDEFAPSANDPTRDNDLTAIIESRCTNTTLGARTLREIVFLPTRGTDYRDQSGHSSGHTGNENY